MWHKPCRTFHPWCLCIKTRCLSGKWRPSCLGLNVLMCTLHRRKDRHIRMDTVRAKSHLTNSTMHQSHTPQCTTLRQKCAHVCTFLLQSGASWDMGPVHCRIRATGLALRWMGLRGTRPYEPKREIEMYVCKSSTHCKLWNFLSSLS